MDAVPVKFVPRGYGETYRRDAWWVEPLVVFLVLGGFVVYGALKATVGLRLSQEEEFDGADLSVHKITATPDRESTW